ncbi:hypothetical protein [Nocardioides convexus]|uniref:hypothetical protein n=1 Tax=Nocardioides convexus TaxID=2712224 RepID=UPI002418A26D|nr:hypothetical protein [Nocardioides convexus]
MTLEPLALPTDTAAWPAWIRERTAAEPGAGHGPGRRAPERPAGRPGRGAPAVGPRRRAPRQRRRGRLAARQRAPGRGLPGDRRRRRAGGLPARHPVEPGPRDSTTSSPRSTRRRSGTTSSPYGCWRRCAPTSAGRAWTRTTRPGRGSPPCGSGSPSLDQEFSRITRDDVRTIRVRPEQARRDAGRLAGGTPGRRRGPGHRHHRLPRLGAGAHVRARPGRAPRHHRRLPRARLAGDRRAADRALHAAPRAWPPRSATPTGRRTTPT